MLRFKVKACEAGYFAVFIGEDVENGEKLDTLVESAIKSYTCAKKYHKECHCLLINLGWAIFSCTEHSRRHSAFWYSCGPRG